MTSRSNPRSCFASLLALASARRRISTGSFWTAAFFSAKRSLNRRLGSVTAFSIAVIEAGESLPKKALALACIASSTGGFETLAAGRPRPWGVRESLPSSEDTTCRPAIPSASRSVS